VPAFVETLDARPGRETAGMPIAPIMIYGDDVSHVVTEEALPIFTRPKGRRSGGAPSQRWQG